MDLREMAILGWFLVVLCAVAWGCTVVTMIAVAGWFPGVAITLATIPVSMACLIHTARVKE